MLVVGNTSTTTTHIPHTIAKDKKNATITIALRESHVGVDKVFNIVNNRYIIRWDTKSPFFLLKSECAVKCKLNALQLGLLEEKK